MITLQHIETQLSQLDQQQLQQVAEFIDSLKTTPPQTRKLTDFYGVFSATVPSADRATERQGVADYLAQKHGISPS